MKPSARQLASLPSATMDLWEEIGRYYVKWLLQWYILGSKSRPSVGTMSQLNSLKGNYVELGEYYCEVDPASSTSRISHCFQKGRQKQYRTTSFIAKQWLRQTLIAKLVQLHSSPCKLPIQLMCPASVSSVSSLDTGAILGSDFWGGSTPGSHRGIWSI